MIRKAVGAIIYQEDEILLVHKVKMSEAKSGPEKIVGEWDFPKGGVKPTDFNLEEALLRELYEETGSKEYQIKGKFDQKVCFEFSQDIKEKIGYDSQETTMFYVEFQGERALLQPIDDEISQVKFVKRDKVLDELSYGETKEYYRLVVIKRC
ncbi:NUDIX hydrolase [Bacillus luteolus]|uniref:NUDIX hydrolase n=1 Tax=Litchfieldia luteola TaxID=682179 RepID=A0ABR9QKM1_9BACI|nr:NUDIX hydrolase [Cytobacillus luteolus]MBE4909055.1 NUDIX hydrolase [Cytobacillus luteolus]